MTVGTGIKLKHIFEIILRPISLIASVLIVKISFFLSSKVVNNGLVDTQTSQPFSRDFTLDTLMHTFAFERCPLYLRPYQ